MCSIFFFWHFVVTLFGFVFWIKPSHVPSWYPIFLGFEVVTVCFPLWYWWFQFCAYNHPSHDVDLDADVDLDQETALITAQMEQGVACLPNSSADVLAHYKHHCGELIHIYEEAKTAANPVRLSFSSLKDLPICRVGNHTCGRERVSIIVQTLLPIVLSGQILDFLCICTEKILIQPNEISRAPNSLEILLFTTNGNLLLKTSDMEVLIKEDSGFWLESTVNRDSQHLRSLDVLEINAGKVFIRGGWERVYSCACLLQRYMSEYLPEQVKRLCSRCCE
jgi:hypothetical protein